jgi:hypothetical protein
MSFTQQELKLKVHRCLDSDFSEEKEETDYQRKEINS